ncbi:hypothetical protein PV326_012070, partial [Microctonus aethiopoides]
RQTILRKGCEISDYFRQFPTLKGALGAELLSEDFKRHHPHAVETFFTRWNCARDIIKTALADCNKLKGVDSGYYSVLPALNQHNKDSVLFHLLPYLINSPRTKHRVGNITISKKEEAFLIRAETAANISGALERQRQICIATGSTLQPIPVIVGPIVNPEAFYVYVNDSLENPTIYQAETFFRIDLPTDKCSRETSALIARIVHLVEPVVDENCDPNQIEENGLDLKHSDPSVEPLRKKRKLNITFEVIDQNECVDNLCSSTSHDILVHETERNISDSVPSTSQDVPQENFSTVQNNYVNFIAKIYSYPDISRHRALEIINDVRDLMNNVLEENDRTISHDKYSRLETLNTEHTIFSEFEKSKNLILPQFLLGERPDYRQRKQITQMKMTPVNAQFIPIRFVFQKFFELPSVFIETLHYVQSLKKNSAIISNFIQGDLWRNLSMNDEDKIVFLLLLYYDDYENNNPLGSHRSISKCGAVYVTIPQAWANSGFWVPKSWGMHTAYTYIYD